MRLGFITLLIASGCDVVYSLDRPPEPADAPPPGSDIATATFVRAVLAEPGGSVMTLPAPDVTATVILANGARPEVTREGDDFRFAWTRGMEYRITFDRPARAPVEYISTAEHLVLSQRELARDGAAPQGNTVLDVTLEDAGAASFTFVMSTGVWAMASSTGQTLSRFAVDWTSKGVFLTGRPRLLTADDELFCTSFDLVNNGSNGLTYNALKRWTSSRYTMVDGAETPVTCSVVDRPLDRCAEIVIEREGEQGRVDASVSPTFAKGNLSYSTVVLAVPSAELGPYNALWLAFQQGNSFLTPFTGSLQYANPFPDHGSAVYSAMFRQRNVHALAALKPVTLSAGTIQFYEPAAGCAVSTAVGDIAMPSPPAFGGAYLVTDGELQLSTTRPIEVSWENRTPGPVDYYLVGLYEIVLADKNTELVEVQSWVTMAKELEMERALLQTGRKYVMSITAQYGWPNVATGDFRTQRWPAPVAAGTNWSSVFSVRP